jgi:hypothetical protein
MIIQLIPYPCNRHIGIILTFYLGVLYMIGIGLNLAGNKIEEFLNSDDFIAVLIGCTFESFNDVMAEYTLSQTAVLERNLPVSAR